MNKKYRFTGFEGSKMCSILNRNDRRSQNRVRFPLPDSPSSGTV